MRSRSRSRSRSPRCHSSSRHQGQLNGGKDESALRATLSSDRPWFTLPCLPVLRSPGTDPQLLRRCEANPFVSLSSSGLLPQPRFESRSSSMASAVPRVHPSHSTTSRSAELPVSTTDFQTPPLSSALVSCLLPASKLLRPADVHVPAYLDFRSRDAGPNDVLVTSSDNQRVSPV